MSSFPLFFLSGNWLEQMQETPNVEISRPLNCMESDFLKRNSTRVAENGAKKSIISWPFSHFCNYFISSSVVKCLLCKSHWEWLSVMISSLLLSVQSPLGTSLRVYPEKKGNVSLRSFVSMRWCSLHCSHALRKHFRMLLAYEITSEKTYRVWCIFPPFWGKHDQTHFYCHRGNKILSSGGNYFCWVCNHLNLGGEGGVRFP